MRGEYDYLRNWYEKKISAVEEQVLQTRRELADAYSERDALRDEVRELRAAYGRDMLARSQRKVLGHPLPDKIIMPLVASWTLSWLDTHDVGVEGWATSPDGGALSIGYYASKDFASFGCVEAVLEGLHADVVRVLDKELYQKGGRK